MVEQLDYQSRDTILRSKGEQSGVKQSARVILKRKSEKISQHLKPLYIKAQVDGLPIDRVRVDGGSTINVMTQIILRI